MKKYIESISNEIMSKYGRLTQLIKHGPSIGRFHEEIIKNSIKTFLSDRIKIRNGFIYNSAKKNISKEVDLIFVDENYPTPYLYQDGNVVIVKEEAVILCVEIKTNFDQKSFADSVEKTLDFKQVKPNGQFNIFFYGKERNYRKKTINNWFKGIKNFPDSISSYPFGIYCLNHGKFQVMPEKFMKPWGMYLVDVNPQYNNISIEVATIGMFIQDIIKSCDLKSKLQTNPYADIDIGTLFLKYDCFRFGKDTVTGSKKI